LLFDAKKFWILLLKAKVPVVRLPAAAFSAIVSLWLGFVTPVAAGYDEGAAAFIRGDYELAWQEWRALGERGHQSAQYNLGVLYSIGLGVDQNDIEASRWFRRAADRGLPAAQMRLGTAYLEGKGVTEDLKEAYFWFTLAATHFSLGEQHEQAVAARESTGAGLTRAQITEVLEKAMGWKPLPKSVDQSEKERLIAEPNGESAVNIESGDPNGLSSDSASLAESQSVMTEVQNGGMSEPSDVQAQDTQAQDTQAQDTESGIPEAQIAELAESPTGSSEAAAEEMAAEEMAAEEMAAEEMAAEEMAAEEMANVQSVKAQNGEPVEQETDATGSGQAEKAEEAEAAAAEAAALELANATDTGGTMAQDTTETGEPAAQESFAAHLSSVRSKDGTESEWQNLQGLFPILLDGRTLAVRSIEVAEQGTFYRVMAGTFDDFSEAQDFCSQLNANQQYCVVRRLGEDPSQ
jgi:TPR repeat protein